MRDVLDRQLAGSGFKFRSGFSDRVMHTLRHSVELKDASQLLTERIGRLFFWINIPTAATLIVVLLLFFVNNYRVKKSEESLKAELNEYVFDYYVSDHLEFINYD